jgi:hypothetical protein
MSDRAETEIALHNAIAEIGNLTELAFHDDQTIKLLKLNNEFLVARVAELEAELDEWKGSCDPGVDNETGNE